MADFPPQVIAAVVAALVSVVIFLGKEAIDRRQASRRTGLTLLWLAKTLRRNLTRSPEMAAHLSMSVIDSHFADIAQNKELSQAFDDIEETIVMWRQGVYQGRLNTDPLCKEAMDLLQSHIYVLSNEYA